MRCKEIEFPLILGRDFSGTVIHKGHKVTTDINICDEVWGLCPLHKQGCHAEYIVVDHNYVTQRPKGISSVEAGCILYAGLTAWSGLFVSGLLGGVEGAFTSRGGGGSGKKVLVLGGSGGVGNFAIQILKAENANVIK